MLISIITPSLDRAEFITEAIESVQSQEYPDIEHIVVDGGSTDGTLDILGSYGHLELVRERDEGLYDALNKGLRRANGEIIGFLNTDDRYEENIFNQVASFFSQHPLVLALAGGAGKYTVYGSGEVIALSEFPAVARDELWERVAGGTPIINAWFFRRAVFARLGLFDIQYRIAADREFLLRLALTGIEFQPVERIFYHYQSHPGSLTNTPVPDPEMPQIAENIKIAGTYLDHPGTPSRARGTLLTWHGELVTRQVVHSLLAMDFGRAAGYIRVGWSRNPAWPLVFTKALFAGVFRRLLHR